MCLRFPILASMEPRLLRRGNTSPPAPQEVAGALQWSHAFSDVETRAVHALQHVGELASMEPRLLRRGNGIRTADVTKLAECFNGATPSQTWKPRSQ